VLRWLRLRYFRRLCLPALVACLVACQTAPGDSAASSHPTRRPPDSIEARAWFDAADTGNAGILSVMLDEGIDPLVERQGLTALHIVAGGGYLDAVQVLVDAGVDVNIGPDESDTRIANAAGHGSPQIFAMMIGREPDPDTIARATSLRTPLNLAVENGHTDVAALLIEAGADVNAGGEWYSPLCSAILFGDAELVELLLEHGARADDAVRIQDRSVFAGFRYVIPVEVARIIERDDLVALLEAHGGR
jgi:ankyrin repeat protein